ncbi:Predicted arabinose efflux permease, MFS family [Sphingobium sp. YR768]|nr:Predicted arabinose efflux permease, MFS family [Sphingobium sp. YR768]
MRWRMLLIAFLAQNLSFGLAFAAFGTLVPMMQATLGIGRTYAVTGLSLMSLSMGLLAPFAGRWLKRFGIRRIMLLGVGIGASGYGMAALAQSGAALLLAYAVLIGPALCLSGVIPASALATGWFDKGKGRALGVVNMPAMTVLAPPMVAWFVEGHGLPATFLMLGALQLALLPLLATIVEPPRQVVVGPEVASADMTSREILRDRGFIILALGIGLLTMAGVGIVTHLVPLAIDRGLSLQQGALLLSAFGIAAIFGAMASGWLVDRSGGRIALTLLALGWTVPWLLLLFAGASLPLLLIAAGAIGFFSGGINPLLTATMGQWLGAGNFGPAMGLCYFVKIPFLFAAAPFDGLLREVSGSYDSAILLHIVGFALVAVLMLALGRR